MPFDSDSQDPRPAMLHVFTLWDSDTEDRLGAYAFELLPTIEGKVAWRTLHDVVDAVTEDPRKELIVGRSWSFDQAVVNGRMLLVPLNVFVTDDELVRYEETAGFPSIRKRPTASRTGSPTSDES